jgi:predicted ATP-binding protein involved in virulence
MVVPGLQVAFPNCQFFISTHSPQVISHVKAENVFILHNDKESGMYYEKVKESYGMSVERVVELLMDDESRPPEVTEKLDILFELIERNKLDEAKKLVAEMKEYLSSDPEIIRAETRIRMEERKK